MHSVRALQEAGHEVKVVVCRPWKPSLRRLPQHSEAESRSQAEREDSLSVETLSHISIPRNLMRSLSNRIMRWSILPALKRLGGDWRPDVIHAHTEVDGCIAVEAGAELGVPVCVSLHGINTCPRLNSKRQIEWYRRWLRQADRIVLVGEPLREYFRRIVGADHHFRVVPNGVRLDLAWALPRNKWPPIVRFIAVANLVKGKGHDLSLHALASLVNEGYTNWKFTIVGGGVEQGRLEALRAELGLQDYITFVGPVPHEEVFSYLQDADVFLLPSCPEAFGIAYAEAMAMGLLAIGVQGQGPASFIRNSETGFLVAPHNVNALVDCLRVILTGSELLLQMARGGQDFVRSEFAFENHARQLTAVFEEAIAAWRRAT
jgi:glycosyltransferase involved in cell wall biosynthesis